MAGPNPRLTLERLEDRTTPSAAGGPPARAQSSTPETLVAQTAGPADGFDITFRFRGLTGAQRATFRRAAARWERAIVGDLPDAKYRGRTVDDVLILVSSVPMDGPGGVLGDADANAYRRGSRLPFFGTINYDTPDLAELQATGQLLNSATHEIGHALGFGTLWRRLHLLKRAGSPAPRYIGEHGLAEYERLLGHAAAGIPVEGGGGPGTADVHWHEGVFRTEMMTGYIDGGRNPLSRMTIASMADLGYEVNLEAGERFAMRRAVAARDELFARGS